MHAKQNEERWYHGTRAPFGRGGWLFPRDFHGGPGTTSPLNPGMKSPPEAIGFVYITRDLSLAWHYAEHAAGEGSPRVLVVEPKAAIERDPEYGYRTDAWRCTAAKVNRVLTSPPGQKSATVSR